jgi:hypothetical protein
MGATREGRAGGEGGVGELRRRAAGGVGESTAQDVGHGGRLGREERTWEKEGDELSVWKKVFSLGGWTVRSTVYTVQRAGPGTARPGLPYPRRPVYKLVMG